MPYYGLPTAPWEQAAYHIVHRDMEPLETSHGDIDPFDPPQQFDSPAHAMEWCKMAGWYPREDAVPEYPGPQNIQTLAEYLLTSRHRYHEAAQRKPEYAQLQPWVGCGGTVTGHDVSPLQKLVDLEGLTRTFDHNNQLRIGHWVCAGQDPPRTHHSGMMFGREGITVADAGLLACLHDIETRSTIDWVRKKGSTLLSHFRGRGNLTQEQWQELGKIRETAQQEEEFSPAALLEYLFTKYGLSGFSQTQHDLIPRIRNAIHEVHSDATWKEFLELLRAFPHLTEYEIAIAGMSLECKAGIERILYSIEHLSWNEAQSWIHHLSSVFTHIDFPTQTHQSYERLIGHSWHSTEAAPEMHIQQTPVTMPLVPRMV